jgi:hypothetical protein
MVVDPHEVLGVPPGAGPAELGRARRRLAQGLHPDRAGGDADRMAAVNAAYDALTAASRRPAPGPKPAVAEPDPRPHLVAGFTIDALPVESFQLLLPALAELGEVLAEDDPYLLEGYIADAIPCFYRLTLVPEAGGTIVTVEAERAEGAPWPSVEILRDRIMATVEAQSRQETGPLGPVS